MRSYGGKARVEWMKTLPCVACGVVGFSQNAHIKTGGAGRKSDARFCVPLCGPQSMFQWKSHVFPAYIGCHASFEEHRAEFRETYPVLDLSAEALRIDALWTEHLASTQKGA